MEGIAGVRPFKWVAVETDCIDLGSGSQTNLGLVAEYNAHTDGSAFAAFAVAFLPIPLPVVDFYFTENFFDSTSSTSSTSSTGTDFGVSAHRCTSACSVHASNMKASM